LRTTKRTVTAAEELHEARGERLRAISRAISRATISRTISRVSVLGHPEGPRPSQLERREPRALALSAHPR
jgi:hypothetical protein